MLRVYDCITGQHDLRFVAVAGIICLFASYTAISLLIRAQLAEERVRLWWISAAAVVAGAGIWATHFIAMLAFRPGIPVAYDLGLTVLSVVIAIFLTWGGYQLALAKRGNAFAGGAVAGLAVACMHYTGMSAVRLPAAAQWDSVYVVSSVVIGAVFCAAALGLATADLSSFRRRAIGATAYVLGIVGLHFTAMAAVIYVPDPRIPIPVEVINGDWLSVAIVLVTVLIIAFGLVGTIVDQRLADRSAREAERLRAHVAELEETRTRLEETTRHLTEALEQAAEASQTKSQFLATMSHELRTPLNAVICLSEFLSSQIYGPLGDDRYQDHAVDIHNSGLHLLELINDILDISKLDSGKLELEVSDIDLSALIADVVRNKEGQAADGGVTLTSTTNPGLPQVRADDKRLRQVLINLLSNAIKFTKSGGNVTVSARQAAGNVVIVVTDNGIGIAAEDIPRAFERFGQVDGTLSRQYEGAGLGLPLSRTLMELHGGGLDLRSRLGEGTTVTMTIPAVRVLSPRHAA